MLIALLSSKCGRQKNMLQRRNGQRFIGKNNAVNCDKIELEENDFKDKYVYRKNP